MPVGLRVGRLGQRGFKGAKGSAGSIASVPLTQTVQTKSVSATTALLASEMNQYILLNAAAGSVITLPAAQAVGTWIVLRIAGNAVAYGAVTFAVDTTVTYMVFATGVWQSMQ
jgi:hypothetical protein